MTYSAPYDERNKADYLAMTERIEAALKSMDRNSGVPATEHSLASLAKCSRATLRNRVYPLERLKEVKRSRLEKKRARSIRNNSPLRERLAGGSNSEEDLSGQLKKSRDEVAVWVDKYFALETEFKRVTRANELLAKGKIVLEEQNAFFRD